MTHRSNSDTARSHEALIDWLRVMPRTWGWDAIAAYDRSKTNQLLLQEYIERFTLDSYLPPVTDSIAIVEGKSWEYIYDYVLDAPRLSFEASSIRSSEARLTMRVIGGTQLTVEKPEGAPRRVTRVAWIDALQGPKLTASIILQNAPGTVSEAGKVFLDISKGTRFELSFAATQHARTLGGSYFQELFDRLPDEKKVFVLNDLARLDAEFVTPERFEVRTHPNPKAADRASGDYGDGAVLLFVAMKGNEGHTAIPDRDSSLHYLLSEGLSSTILLGHHFLIKKIVRRGIERLANAAFDLVIEIENEDNPDAKIGRVNVTRGAREDAPWELASQDKWLVGVDAPTLKLGEPNPNDYASFHIEVEDDCIRMLWGGNQRLDGRFETPSQKSRVYFIASWGLDTAFRFLPGDAGGIRLDIATELTHCRVSPGGDLAENSAFRPYATEIVAGLDGRLRAFLDSAVRDFSSPTSEIELFRLNGLLFRGDNVLRLEEIRLPTDLAMFGDLGPRQTAFEIAPLEKIVGAGSTLRFDVSPRPGEVTWRVENVPGYDGDPGRIDADGLYVAPARPQVNGAYKRVKVTASTSTHSSSALVTVVVRDVVLDPLVLTASLGGGGIALSAGTLDGGSLQWDIETTTGGRVEPVLPGSRAETDGAACTYVPGPEQESPAGTFSIDTVIAKNSRSGSVAQSSVLVIQKIPLGLVQIDRKASLPDGQVQLQLTAQDTILNGVEWTLRAGSGSVDRRTGIYSVDPQGEHRFALITGHVKLQNILDIDGYIILPLPLLDLEEVKAILA